MVSIDSDKLFEYVQPLTQINEDLKCLFCKFPLEDPITQPECGTMVCSDCCKKEIEKNNTKCPGKDCKNDLKSDKTTTPMYVNKQLDNLEIKCKVCNDPTTLKRSEFLNHLENNCKTQCKLGCGTLLTKSQVNTHNLVCKKFHVECKGKDVLCKWQGVREDKSNHEKSCPNLALEPVLDFLLKTIHNLEGKVNTVDSNLNTLKEKYGEKLKNLN